MSLGRTTLLAVAVLAGLLVDLGRAHAQSIPITYVRCARTHAPMMLTGEVTIGGGLPFRHGNGTIGGFTTLSNLFHLYTQRPDGAVPFAFFGQHSGDHSPTSSIGSGHNAARFVARFAGCSTRRRPIRTTPTPIRWQAAAATPAARPHRSCIC
jgi:hypothetical protein